jgi:hypothetical protein
LHYCRSLFIDPTICSIQIRRRDTHKQFRG